MEAKHLFILAAFIPVAGRAAPITVASPDSVFTPSPSLEGSWAAETQVFDVGLQAQTLAPLGALPEGLQPLAPLQAAPNPAQTPIQAPPAEPTPLQKHAAFFDRNGDGIITLSETVESLRMLGLGWAKANAIALAIHVGLGPKTSGRWNSLDIDISKIAAGVHPSDTGVFDAKGYFVAEAFEAMFAQFDTDGSGALSEPEIAKMVAAHAAQRPGAAFAAKAEFSLLLDLAADRTETVDGQQVRALSKERLRSFYDGSLFYELAAQRRSQSHS